jgi:hypothetical protein
MENGKRMFMEDEDVGLKYEVSTYTAWSGNTRIKSMIQVTAGKIYLGTK